MNYDFRTFTFGVGGHASREEGMCFMEAVAYVAGEEHSDRMISLTEIKEMSIGPVNQLQRKPVDVLQVAKN